MKEYKPKWFSCPEIRWVCLIVLLVVVGFPVFTGRDWAGAFSFPVGSLPCDDRISEGVPPEVENQAITEAEKQQLKEDAKKLNEDLHHLFQELGGLSRKMAESMVGTLGDWIEQNYERLSHIQREKLQQFLERMDKEYKGLREMTEEKWRQLAQSIAELLRMLDDRDDRQKEKAGDKRRLEI